MDYTPEQTQDLVNIFVGAAHGDFEKVKSMHQEYPHLLNASASWQETAIQAAAQTGRVDIAEYLLAEGASLDICTAAMLGRKEQVESMLKNSPGLIDSQGAHGIPLLYFAVIGGHRDVAEYLLAQGAEVNAGEGGTTPLHGAVMFNRLDMAAWLLEHGAQVDAPNYSGKTALALAKEEGQEEMAQLLKSYGANE